MIAVPERLAVDIVATQGAAGQSWLERLPAIVTQLCEHWQLRVDGPAMHGYVALVVPVRGDDGESYVVKVSWVDEETRHECTALRRWNGQGAVRLLAEDAGNGAMLLERLDAGRSLATEPHDRACEIVGNLARRLWVPPPPSLPRLIDLALLWANDAHYLCDRVGQPVPALLLSRAVRAHIELTAGGFRPSTLHRDLHYSNVLAGSREPWLAIDPKPLSGDPHYELFPLLRNRFDEVSTPALLRRRLALLAESSGLDLERAREWAIARAVDDWIWRRGVGGPQWQDIETSACVARWLAE